jgi:hypothetical protein
MLKQHFRIKAKKLQQVIALIVVILVAGIGTYLLTGSHAATPYSSVTADSGTLNNGATQQSCSGASDGSCVLFGSGTSSGGGVTGTDSNKGVPWIGLNDFTGWGPPLTHQYLSDGFRWARISVDGNYAANNAIDSTLSTGCGDGTGSDPNCNALVILPDNASEAMSWMNHYNTPAYASRLVYEFGNEQYLTNSGYTLTAQAYAQAYETAYNEKHAANIPQPLLFMTTGNPCWGSLTEDACSTDGELYIEKAMDASQGGVPNLKVDGFSTHTYGGANGNWNNDTNGVDALLAQHQDAVAHGFTNTPWYVTEWGVTLDPSQSDGQPSSSGCFYATSYAMQATCITDAYNQMVSYGDGVNGTWLQGIMYYQTHDDSTGWWGLLTSPNAPTTDSAGEAAGGETACTNGQPPPPCGTANTPINLRPSYYALNAFLTNH